YPPARDLRHSRRREARRRRGDPAHRRDDRARQAPAVLWPRIRRQKLRLRLEPSFGQCTLFARTQRYLAVSAGTAQTIGLRIVAQSRRPGFRAKFGRVLQMRSEDSSKDTLPQILASLSTLLGEQQQIVWQQSVIGSSVPVFVLLYSSLKLVRICGSYPLQQ